MLQSPPHAVLPSQITDSSLKQAQSAITELSAQAVRRLDDLLSEPCRDETTRHFCREHAGAMVFDMSNVAGRNRMYEKFLRSIYTTINSPRTPAPADCVSLRTEVKCCTTRAAPPSCRGQCSRSSFLLLLLLLLLVLFFFLSFLF